MKRKTLVLGLLAVAAAGILCIPVGGSTSEPRETSPAKVRAIDMSEYEATAPGRPFRLLFIHHSCGGQLLAPPGDDVGTQCIYQSHPNGGGLRPLLEKEGYGVHEVSYGSEIGDKTDIFDWPPKFGLAMEKVLTASGPDTYYSDGSRNEVVAFKPCFPNNWFVAEGSPPGNPEGPELTVANAKAAYSALLPEFAKHREVLFVAVTAPPLVGKSEAQPLWKFLARKVLNKPRRDVTQTGPLARQFNNWLKAEDGWLKGYPQKNVVVFDYYDILTDEGASNFLRYPTGADGSDSHPSAAGNTKAAQAFVPFLNRAVRRAELIERN